MSRQECGVVAGSLCSLPKYKVPDVAFATRRHSTGLPNSAIPPVHHRKHPWLSHLSRSEGSDCPFSPTVLVSPQLARASWRLVGRIPQGGFVSYNYYKPEEIDFTYTLICQLSIEPRCSFFGNIPKFRYVNLSLKVIRKYFCISTLQSLRLNFWDYCGLYD